MRLIYSTFSTAPSAATFVDSLDIPSFRFDLGRPLLHEFQTPVTDGSLNLAKDGCSDWGIQSFLHLAVDGGLDDGFFSKDPLGILPLFSLLALPFLVRFVYALALATRRERRNTEETRLTTSYILGPKPGITPLVAGYNKATPIPVMKDKGAAVSSNQSVTWSILVPKYPRETSD
jgi:hypothetical protein